MSKSKYSPEFKLQKQRIVARATSTKNSNSLLFLDKRCWSDGLIEIGVSPNVVLLSSHEYQNKESNFQELQSLITKLIDLGCKHFVCAGKNSEQLHDFIDNIILDVSLSVDHEGGNDIMTTWHDTDTNEEVADFFLHSTNVSDSLLIAILDETKIEDISLKKSILNLIS